MIYNMFKAYLAIAATFHKPIAPLFTFLGIFLLRIIVSVGMALDFLFFPSLHKQKVINPIVIVGNPRSGTTFLQRFLVEQKTGVGMKLWKLLYPSLTLQKIFQPLLPLMEKISPARFHFHAAHETNLTAVETEDPALLFRFFDGFFVYGFFLAFAKKDLKARFDPLLRDTSNRDFQWLDEIWKRNLISERHHIEIAKVFSLAVRIPQFLKYFPDAKILYTVRDPLETVPSGLSLVTGVLDARFGFWKLPEHKRTIFIERLYSALLELSLRFHEDFISGLIPKEKLKIVRYDELMNDFESIMRELIEFLGIEMSVELSVLIRKTSEKQCKYKSSHEYSLEMFGLNEDRIRHDYKKIYETFLFSAKH